MLSVAKLLRDPFIFRRPYSAFLSVIHRLSRWSKPRCIEDAIVVDSLGVDNGVLTEEEDGAICPRAKNIHPFLFVDRKTGATGERVGPQI